MGKIYYIMGKSSSGKDTLFRKIKQELPMLQTVTLYTTRPKREGEREGVEYHFVTDEQMHIFDLSVCMKSAVLARKLFALCASFAAQ